MMARTTWTLIPFMALTALSASAAEVARSMVPEDGDTLEVGHGPCANGFTQYQWGITCSPFCFCPRLFAERPASARGETLLRRFDTLQLLWDNSALNRQLGTGAPVVTTGPWSD